MDVKNNSVRWWNIVVSIILLVIVSIMATIGGFYFTERRNTLFQESLDYTSSIIEDCDCQDCQV